MLETKAANAPVGWHRVPNGIMRNKQLRPTEKFLIYGLYEWWNTNGRQEWFYASNRDLSAFCGISEPSLITSRARLQRSDWIEVKIGRRQSRGIDRLASSYKLSQMLKDAVSNTPLPLKTSSLVDL